MASDIAQNACVSKALVSRSVKELREKGLISASISEVDKREQKLSLTPEGEKAAQLIADANQNFIKLRSDASRTTKRECFKRCYNLC